MSHFNPRTHFFLTLNCIRTIQFQKQSSQEKSLHFRVEVTHGQTAIIASRVAIYFDDAIWENQRPTRPIRHFYSGLVGGGWQLSSRQYLWTAADCPPPGSTRPRVARRLPFRVASCVCAECAIWPTTRFEYRIALRQEEKADASDR